MATPIAPPQKWAPCDQPWAAKNWTRAADGTQQRQTNRSDTLNGIAQRINHLLGLQPRTVFMQAYPIGTADTGGKDPLHVFKYTDGCINGRTLRYRILAVPRTSGTGDAQAKRTGASDATGKANATYASVGFADQFVHEISYARGNAPASEQERGISTFNGYTVLDVCVEDARITALDFATHDVCSVNLAPGQGILANALEHCRDKFHRARVNNLSTIASWAAIGNTTKPGAAPGDASGLRIDSTTLVNVLDQAVAARSGTSPGISAHALYCGRGPEWTTAGRKVKVLCRVYAEKDSADAGTVRFIGPDFVANNYTDIAVTGDAAAGWWGSASNYIYLDSMALDDATGTGRNKIDIHAKCASAGSLYLWALHAEHVWE